MSRVRVYIIWYGDWTSNNATVIIPSFLRSLNGSGINNIITTYSSNGRSSGPFLSNSITYSGSVAVKYSRGSTITDSDIQAIVLSVVGSTTSPSLPYDPYGLYYVLTSRDVIESSGFCTQFCGWHSYTTGAAGNIKFSFVGDSSQCPSACSAQTISPNSNLGADAMISVIAHELWEAQTDPLFNAWYDTAGYENADKCAWTFGATSQLSSGASYNVRLGGLPYLIQQNWDAKNGRCRLTYP